MAEARLSAAEREQLEAKRERLRVELRMVEGELRSDAVLRVARGRSEVALRQRSEYLKRLYGR